MRRRPATDQEREDRREQRMRRRFARRQWARRWGVWKPALALLLLLVLAGTGVWLVWFSSVLAVEKVTVRGIDHLTRAEVVEQAKVPTGRPLARVDLAAIERRVATLAPAREVDVRRDWPDTVVVTVTEREAIAVLEMPGQVKGIDREGVPFRDFDKVPPNLPRVRVVGEVDHETRREAARVVTSLPDDLVTSVQRVEVETVDQITLVLDGERTVVWGSAEQSEEKAAVLAALVKAADAKTYDVSVPGQPVTSD